MKRQLYKKTLQVFTLLMALIYFAPSSYGSIATAESAISKRAATPHQQRNQQRKRKQIRRMVTPDADERDFLNISVTTVQRRSISSFVEANGIFSALPDRMAKVGPVISGRVSEVLAELGDWVEAGQPMAKLVSVEIGAAVSEYYKAVAELELARIDYERYKRLISQDIGARKDLLAAEAAYKIAGTSPQRRGEGAPRHRLHRG